MATIERPVELDVRPTSGHTGAEIHGVDLAQPLDAATVAAIRAALLRWKVVFFRDQDLDHDAQIRFGRAFGDVTPGHPYEGDVAPTAHPEIHTVSPAAYDARYGASYTARRGVNGPGWHADVTPLINPPSHSILRAESVPGYGGDTHFTNVAAAYADLSEPLRGFIDGLHAEHRFGASHDAAESDERIGDWVRRKPLASIHPVVRVHPESGERVLYVNPSFTTRIVELSPAESRALLELLFRQLGRPEFQARFRWQVGSVAFWDNRAALHLAPRDVPDLGVDRVLHRITLVGDVPVGVDGRRSQALEGDPFLAA